MAGNSPIGFPHKNPAFTELASSKCDPWRLERWEPSISDSFSTERVLQTTRKLPGKWSHSILIAPGWLVAVLVIDPAPKNLNH